MPDDKDINANMETVSKISDEVEKVFFEQSAENKLSVYEMSIIYSRLGLLFEEYKMIYFLNNVNKKQSKDKTIGIHGKDSIYR